MVYMWFYRKLWLFNIWLFNISYLAIPVKCMVATLIKTSENLFLHLSWIHKTTTPPPYKDTVIKNNFIKQCWQRISQGSLRLEPLISFYPRTNYFFKH